MRGFVVSVLTILLTVTPLVASSAKAASLWWIKVITTQKTFAGCMREAENGARRSLGDVRVTPDEVSGFSIDQQVYFAITCVERGSDQRAVAIIAGVGDDINWVRQVVQNTTEVVRTSGVPDY
jgi:hypothetical protein